MSWEVRQGDVLDWLREMPDGSVHCCVTSPPYWGLRDYGVAGQLGLEPTPEAYVARMVEVFREVRRVLRDDGTLWLNVGDSYAASGPAGGAGKQHSNIGSINVPVRNAPPGLKPKDLVGIPWRLAFALQADGWYLRSDIIWAKPNPMPESVTDRPTKAHEYLFLFAKGQRKTRVIALADLAGDIVHLGKNLGLQSPDAGAGAISVALASSILDCPEFQEKFGLSTLDPKVWKKRLGDCGGVPIGGLPVEHRAALLCSRLLDADCSTKEFLSELNRLGVTLTDGNNLLIGGVEAKIPLSPPLNAYGKTAVAIHDSGKVCKFDFGHAHIVLESPNGCNYYYDAEAIKDASDEPWRAGVLETCFGPSSPVGTMRNDTGREVMRTTTRNRRTVWTIPTQPYPEAHFATYPEALVEPCIKAGCPEGGTVLDPFSGSGTTGAVAVKHGRNYIGIELNPAYIALSHKRIGMALNPSTWRDENHANAAPLFQEQP